MKVRLYDLEFAHLNCFCGYDAPANIEWVREGEGYPIEVFSDRCLDDVKQSKAKIKIAWLNEPYAIHDYGYEKIRNELHEYFDYVLTHNQHLIAFLKPGKGVWYPNGGAWIWREDWNIYPKTKLSQIIASSKTWTDGHRLRHEIIQKIGNKIEYICGNGTPNPFNYKLDVLKDFKFAVVIENSICGDYWTDKIIDCFATGTVPIFWGGDFLNKYFDMSGIMRFESVDQLSSILDMININGNLYETMMPGIKKNFDIAKNKYMVIEDYLYDNFFKRFEDI